MTDAIQFNERPEHETKISAQNYVAKLLQDAKLNNDSEATDNLVEIQRLINGKKYGLVWEEHEEQVEVEMNTKIPVFEEVPERKLTGNSATNAFNFLLEGDNLHSLHILEKTHRNAIDVIYIDPPYNTGAKNWRYNNAFVDDKDSFKHSKWISFMNARLKIAKNLLKQDGVLVLTIDDYEIENITLLLNDIFGEDNHLGTIVVKNNPSGRSTTSGVAVAHEYALFYGASKSGKLGRLPRSEKQVSRYKEIDEVGRFEWVNFRARYSTDSPSMQYPIFIDETAMTFRLPKMSYDAAAKTWLLEEEPKPAEIVSYPIDDSGKMRSWKWGVEAVLEKKNDLQVRLNNKKQVAVYAKARMNSEGMLPLTVWDDTKYSSTEYGTNMLTDILGEKLFDYPKSLYAVIDSLKVANAGKDSVVLDFFAGSGTTGHAVAELNAEDGGHRTFILATNNENKIAEEVTYQRIKNISNGVAGKSKIKETLFDVELTKKELQKAIKNSNYLQSIFDDAEEAKERYLETYGENGNATAKVSVDNGHVLVTGSRMEASKFEAKPLNLKYFKTKFIQKNDESLERKLLESAKQLIELKYGVDLDGSHYKMIKNLSEVDEVQLEGVTDIFIRHQVRAVLTPLQEQRFRDVVLHDIPDTFFASEFREMGL